MPVVKQQSRIWPIVALLMTIVAACLLIAVIALAVKTETSDSASSGASGALPSCGTPRTSNKNVLELGESPTPGPFHDLTIAEIENVRSFLENSPDYDVYKAGREDMSQMAAKTSIVTMDLLPAPKAEILAALDNNEAQPQRRARVMLLRLNQSPQVVEEVVCRPLPVVASCTRRSTPSRRNPVEVAFLPLTLLDYVGLYGIIIPQVEAKLGNILQESFGARFSGCDDGDTCLDFLYFPIPSSVHGAITQRMGWMHATYKVESKYLRLVDISFQVVQPEGQGPSVGALWYAGQHYSSMDSLVSAYAEARTPKVRLTAPKPNMNHFSTMHVRNEFPGAALRPPTLVEPDGKRYSVNHRHVTYLGWQFDFRLSSLTGPAVYDVRYKGERIVYELGLQEIAVFYSGSNELRSTLNLIDSCGLLGIYAKSLVQGADCPNTAVFIGSTFDSMLSADPAQFSKSFCIFEQNDGIPLVRHHDYSDERFYSGMLDSYLTLRTILAIGNYDYIIDFMFHQNGVMNTRISSAGYIMPSHWNENSHPFGHQIAENLLGNIHHHLFHFKADVDIDGTRNRYETLDLERVETSLPTFQNKVYHQMQMIPDLKTSEKKAVYKCNFNKPKYHVVHNNGSRTRFGEIKAYRINVDAMSKQLLNPGDGAEVSIPWARQQLVVTRQKDDELESSSPYAIWDSLSPVTDFSTFYDDDEDIIDKDLVFWVTLGTHHIPHTEDIPTTSASGTRLSFSLMPHNYFADCPSVSSRDSVRLQPWNPTDHSQGVAMLNYGKADSQCVTPVNELKQEVKDDPDDFLQMGESKGIL